VRVIPSWVDAELFTPRRRDDALRARFNLDGQPVLVFAGPVTREDGADLLAEAFRDVVDAGLGVHLLVAGDGPHRAEMEERLAGYPATFLGLMRRRDLAGVYASSDLVVFPSCIDASGLAVLEAQAAGLPAIVCDRGGPGQYVRHGDTGLVVRGGDRAALADAIRTLLADDPRRRAMSRAARAHVLAIAVSPHMHGETVLEGLHAPAPAPGWRRPGAVRNAARRSGGRRR
jgi:glycosyltransferase involved in cell wall biosynthesis